MRPAPQLGDLLAGKYRLLSLLGQGGMGIVFEAQHELTNKRVAIKLLRPELSLRPLHVQRMLREAQASARIRHPNVVDVLDVGSEGDTFFLVMEYLDGETLGARLKRGPLAIAETLALLMPAMRGVAAGHALGIVHRDIKPDNIFLARLRDQPAPLPKVLDFGISKLLSGDDLSLTESGTTLGTPLYMSYEQLTGTRDVDAQSDVYAFGVLLYEALTGRTPYRAETLGSLAVQVATTRPRRPGELTPGLPAELDNIVMHALARDRSARFLSLDALLAALAPLTRAAHVVNHDARPLADSASLPTVSVAALKLPPTAVPEPAPAKRSGRLVAAVALSSALAVGAAVMVSRELSSAPAPSSVSKVSADSQVVHEAPALPQAPLPAMPVEHDAGASAEPAPALREPSSGDTVRRPERRNTVHGARTSADSEQPSAVAPEPAPASAPAAHERPSHRAGTPRLDEF